uniref:Uncharacterized protein n=1 Tax=Arundo donax TaxID=35708 RepID=A0A0A9FFS5_ARUDO
MMMQVTTNPTNSPCSYVKLASAIR